MELRSIENFNLVNLENCDQEPISVPGSIQEHGFLLVLDTLHIIRFCSANVSHFNMSAGDLLGNHINKLLDEEQAASLASYIAAGNFETSRPHTSRYKETDYHTTIHISGDYILLEFEPFPDGSLQLSNLYLQTKKFTTVLSKTIGLKNLCQFISEEIKQVTGYDRVMVYKFDEHYNGEVFAEAKNDDIESFLGIHYPHTDIPVQARELYLRNLMRMIVDVNYKPVPILTKDPNATNQHIDLSHSVLRSVSPIHIDYLKNMGVSGTLTISLVLEGKLWGLIACHHYAPKNIPYYIRLSALMQGHFLTSQIRVQEVTTDYERKVELDKKFKDFLAVLDVHSANEEKEIASEELTDITVSNGVCIVSDSELQSFGDIPDNADILRLIETIGHNNNQFIYTANAARDFNIKLSNQVAGFLYHRIDAATVIIWFRNELTKEITWAGEPHKSVIKDKNGLSPRKSFALWKEKVNGLCDEWHTTELNVANQCVYAIQKHFSLLMLKKIQRTQDGLLTKLKQANEELENINWISTHDLKEPLRKMRVFASILLDRNKFDLNDESVHLLNRLSSSADKMQKLLDDLLSFARVKDGVYDYELCDLNALLRAVLANNEDTIADQQIAFELQLLPHLYCLPVLLEQLFSNLISNSIKFASEDVPLVIKIGSRALKNDDGIEFCEITIADNGKGFEDKYSDLIFQVFQRLDKNSDVTGSGIGLAICKKIAVIHKGAISATGTPDHGAEFRILLPYRPQDLA